MCYSIQQLPIAQQSLTAIQEFYNRIREISDQKSYLYDDGSEMGSALCLEPQRRTYKHNQGKNNAISMKNVSGLKTSLIMERKQN